MVKNSIWTKISLCNFLVGCESCG
ncbi:hypothetical protein CY0110_17497 [Crocosphaera chwakensis CCY0110]|uniref:Uncharacterized protein n=1 Tax=Crocosphaera chwakensis CCY0110 TaxID=391612 RepID=A3III1_9CHRO|nr:hypothetical protein CY0110_17497 [Crocosphaera chwakensis CCY0110]